MECGVAGQQQNMMLSHEEKVTIRGCRCSTVRPRPSIELSKLSCSSYRRVGFYRPFEVLEEL